jgi:hypothetical protein
MEKTVENAFEQRMEARRKREEASVVPEETEEQKQEKLRSSYMKRTNRTSMTSTGSGKGPRIVK